MIFGDIEPEDSWHPDDPLPVLVDNLARRLPLLDVARPWHDDVEPDDLTIAELVEEIADALDDARHRDNNTPRDWVRIGHLADDLDHVQRRIYR